MRMFVRSVCSTVLAGVIYVGVYPESTFSLSMFLAIFLLVFFWRITLKFIRILLFWIFLTVL